jgi:HEAT repeat protein
MTDLPTRLGELFDAERAVRTIHSELALRPKELLPVLEAAMNEARGLSDRAEAVVRLVRIAELLGEVGGPGAIDRLIDLMGVEDPEPRVVAGEEIEELAYARFKEVAQAVERAIVRLDPKSPALVELPYLLAEIPEGGAYLLLGRFLKLKAAEPVAAAIEALVEVGDPEAIAWFEPLEGDKRTVSMEDVEADASITIGELAAEAIDILQRAKSDE